jgi:hypothetical protein
MRTISSKLHQKLVKLVKFVVKKKIWETFVVLLEEVVEVEVVIG